MCLCVLGVIEVRILGWWYDASSKRACAMHRQGCVRRACYCGRAERACGFSEPCGVSGAFCVSHSSSAAVLQLVCLLSLLLYHVLSSSCVTFTWWSRGSHVAAAVQGERVLAEGPGREKSMPETRFCTQFCISCIFNIAFEGRRLLPTAQFGCRASPRLQSISS